MRRPFSAWFRSFARGKIRRGSHRAKNKRSSDFLRRRVARVESLEPRRMLAADLDFDQVAILADPFQDGQSGSPTLAEPLDGGKTLHLEGNAWKYVQVDYPVTAETILSFDFSSDAEGELHGVELANDLTYSTNTHFQLYGTQT